MDTRQLASNDVGIWDVAGAGNAAWNKDLGIKVRGNPVRLKQRVSDFLCTDRNLILSALTGAAPFIFMLLALSWVFEDFPWIRKKWFSKKLVNQIVLWALLWIVFAAFALLLYGMPSLDLQNIGVYVVLATFAVSIIYIILAGLSMLSKRDYP